MPYYSLLPILERKRLEKNNLVLSLQIRTYYTFLLGPYYTLLHYLLEKNNLVLLQIRTYDF